MLRIWAVSLHLKQLSVVLSSLRPAGEHMALSMMSLFRDRRGESKTKTTQMGGFVLAPELGEREKTIKYRFFEVKSTKQGVTGVSIRATHNDYAA